MEISVCGDCRSDRMTLRPTGHVDARHPQAGKQPREAASWLVTENSGARALKFNIMAGHGYCGICSKSPTCSTECSVLFSCHDVFLNSLSLCLDSLISF
uniref:Uncharacterized protein n=1 Tax=Electrophorus electricus TaxID=8005 RepID=A0A4W4DMN4_ELEEL